VAAGVDVILIQLQAGMETVANTKTDAQGRYQLEHASIGLQPMLVRVNYRGVNFHQALPPGRNIADVEVFEQTTNASAMQVASRVIVLQPEGAQLVVGEEYAVENHSKPPASACSPRSWRSMCTTARRPGTTWRTPSAWMRVA